MASTITADVRTALRLSSTSFDDEIEDLIAACLEDLYQAGIGLLDEDDPLIKQAAVLYCKAHFGLDNPDAERYTASYEALKARLSVLEEYQVGGLS